MNANALYYAPWLGATPTAHVVPGCRLLVLGESHYEETGNAYAHRPGLTCEMLERIAADQQHVRFFTNLGRILASVVNEMTTPSRYDHRDVWATVAFSNLIQHPLATSSTVPTASDWGSLDRILPMLIGQVQPNAVLVASQRAWDAISCRFPMGWQSHPTSALEVYRWDIGTPRIIYASWCAHPSRALLKADKRKEASARIGSMLLMTQPAS